MAKEKIVVWDAGHSNTDPGAVGYVRERDVNVKVVKYAIEYMELTYVCKNFKTRPEDSLIKRCAMANVLKADLFVSVHFNAGGGDGYEVLVYSKQNVELGKCFEEHVKETGQNSRGVKLRPDLAVLKYTNMPAVLNEMAFVDNKKDIKDWNEDHELKELGIALAEATAEVLGLPLQTKKANYETLCAMNMRKSPSLNSTVLGTVPEGIILRGTEVAGGWLKTTYNKKTGYVRTKGQKTYCKKV